MLSGLPVGACCCKHCPERSQHQALDALYVGIRGKKVNWILDLDLKGFFDNIDKEHLMALVGLRIADTRVLRLIQKWLNAGIVEEGVWSETEKGTPLWAFRPAKPGGTWGRETGVVYFSRLSAYMCGEQSGKIRNPAHHGRRTTAEETAGYAIPATGRTLLVSCAGTAQPKATRLGKTGETFRSLAARATHCS